MKGADTKAKRDLSSALDQISEQITTDFQPKGPFGEADSENKIRIIFQLDMAERVSPFKEPASDPIVS